MFSSTTLIPYTPVCQLQVVKVQNSWPKVWPCPVEFVRSFKGGENYNRQLVRKWDGQNMEQKNTFNLRSLEVIKGRLFITTHFIQMEIK
jgi:hypothetical protein